MTAPTSKEQSNQATPLTEDLVALLQQTLGDQMGYATSLQRNLGEQIGGTINQFSQPFDTGPQIAAMREIHAQDRQDATGLIAEQMGIAGNRTGTPIAVGTAKTLGSLIPQQSAQIGDLLMRAYQSQGQFLPAMFGAQTGLINSVQNPYLTMGAAGTANPAQGPSVLQQAGGFIGSLFG